MSDDGEPNSSAPRRSQRDRKIVQPFISAPSGSAALKRKRSDTDTENDAPDLSDQEEEDQQPSEDEDNAEDDEDEPKTPKPKRGRKPKAKSSPKEKATPVAKKPRAQKTTGFKLPKATARRGRKVKEGDDAYDADQVAKDTKISADNPLFNAIMNPASPLQSSAEEFLESLQHTPGAALAELINLVLRSCGCNESVDADQAQDFDGIVSILDDFSDILKQENSPLYPLTSKLPVFKRFRKSLSEWIERLIISASDLGALYTSQMMETLQQWVVSMSSSHIRSFRHTATVIALEAETALCEVAAAVDKEHDVVARQREGEKKRKGKGAQLKEIETKAKEVKKRQSKLKAYITEFVDGVFVHRFRDLDPNIRAECVRSIGLWIKKYPEHFLDANYLRYIGWVLSDSNNHVRLEAVKSLTGVYQPERILTVTNFTERFKSRLLEMATSDVDLSIRVAVIQVLGTIEDHFPLEDSEKEQLCLLLFDQEQKVRHAVSSFVRAVWEAEIEELGDVDEGSNEKHKDRVAIKVLASLFVRWGKSLDTLAGDSAESEIGEVDADGDDTMNGAHRNSSRRKEVIALVGSEDRGRIALAVEALWGDIEPISDWEGLLDLLLLDHSATDESPPGPKSRKGRVNGKKNVNEFQVDDAWRLEEIEESTLLEVLVASIRMAKEESTGGKKGEEENISNDVTRALIKGLPRLFAKHQSDQNRIAEVLVIPTLMNLDLYLEMRMISAYANLWDDVIKQFMSHSSAKVLAHAMAAIRYFMDATSLSNTNGTKILELEDELSSQLRDTIAGREEIEIASFSEDEVHKLTAWCMRLAVLAGTRDMKTWIEEDEGGKQSSAWDIVNALVERGRLGYKEEEMMIEQALHVLMLHVLWKTKGLSAELNPPPDEVRYKEVMQEQRESLLEKLVEYVVGTQSNTVEGVKRAAFKHLLDLHVLFSSANLVSPDGTPLATASLALTLDDEVQYRCAGYIQAEIERYADILNEDDDKSEKSDEGSEDGEDGDGESPKKNKRKKAPRETDLSSRDLLEREYLFIDVVSTFLRAIRAGAIHVQHGAVVLAHYGRLEFAFDTCSKVVVDCLREDQVMKENPALIVATITQAVQEAHTLVLDGVVRDESNGVQLAKLLSTCFIVRGSQLAVLRRLPSQHIVQVHTNLLTWISKRIAGYNKNKNNKGLKSAISFFKVLQPLVVALQSRDVLQIKAHMDQVLESAGVEISATAKVWEPQRAYEKRLNAVMAKENPQAPKAKRTRKKGAAGAASEDETDGERTNDEDAPAQTKSRPRRVTRSNPVVADDEGGEESGGDEGAIVVTPKAKPRPKPRAKGKKPVSAASAGAGVGAIVVSPRTPVRTPRNTAATVEEGATPKSTRRKRAREEEEEEEEVANGHGHGHGHALPTTNGTGNGNGTRLASASPPPSEEEPEIQVRRKRIRH